MTAMGRQKISGTSAAAPQHVLIITPHMRFLDFRK
jgi:hypothetical protein